MGARKARAGCVVRRMPRKFASSSQIALNPARGGNPLR
nr:unnamed protein product [Digitaria exilis]